jgi:hypothetical protein
MRKFLGLGRCCGKTDGKAKVRLWDEAGADDPGPDPEYRGLGVRIGSGYEPTDEGEWDQPPGLEK